MVLLRPFRALLFVLVALCLAAGFVLEPSSASGDVIGWSDDDRSETDSELELALPLPVGTEQHNGPHEPVIRAEPQDPESLAPEPAVPPPRG